MRGTEKEVKLDHLLMCKNLSALIFKLKFKRYCVHLSVLRLEVLHIFHYSAFISVKPFTLGVCLIGRPYIYDYY